MECDEINKLINDYVKEINKAHAPYEHLKRCKLINGWSMYSEVAITPKLSLKRKVIKEKNKAVIDAIFGSGKDRFKPD